MLTEISDELPLRNDVFRLERTVHEEAVATSALPPDLSDPPACNLEQAARGLLV